MNDLKKNNEIIQYIISGMFVVFGLILLLYGNEAVRIILNIIGGLIIALSVFKIVRYSTGQSIGYIGIVVGLLIMAFSGTVMFFFRFIIAGWIIYSGIMRLNRIKNIQNINPELFKQSKIIAISLIAIGIIVLLFGGLATALIGIIMLVYSGLTIYCDISYKKDAISIEKKQKDDK